MKITALGHSHLTAISAAWAQPDLQRALSDTQFNLVSLRQDPFKDDTERVSITDLMAPAADGTPLARRNARAAARIKASSAYAAFGSDDKLTVLTVQAEERLCAAIEDENPDAVVLFPKGNEYLRFCLVNLVPPLRIGDTIEIGQPTAVPLTVMKAQMRLICEESALLYLRLIAQTTKLPVLLVPPPPPIGNDTHLMAYPGTFQERLDKYGLGPRELRLQVYDLYKTVLQEAAVECGATFVDIPENVQEKGFLRDEFLRTDPVHANAKFGAIIIRSIRDRVDAMLKAT